MVSIIAFVVGVIIGGAAVIVFSKNNKNTIAGARSEILEAANKVENKIKNAKK